MQFLLLELLGRVRRRKEKKEILKFINSTKKNLKIFGIVFLYTKSPQETESKIWPLQYTNPLVLNMHGPSEFYQFLSLSLLLRSHLNSRYKHNNKVHQPLFQCWVGIFFQREEVYLTIYPELSPNTESISII